MTTLPRDRPRGPYLDLKNGLKILADYHWRDQKPGFPDWVNVLVDKDGNGEYMTVIAALEGPFENWDEIHELAVKAGTSWCEKGNG